MDPTKKVFSFMEQFKNFALKGNVIDLAVGVIIGAAFGKIITSLVENIIMPIIGALIPGQQGYQDLGVMLNGHFIPTGVFAGDVVNFLIVAFALFVFFVKFIGFIMHAKKQEAAVPPPFTRDQELLTEIRDLLKRDIAPGR